jgi:ribosomal protein S18 acetylase RimI-like enzyme
LNHSITSKKLAICILAIHHITFDTVRMICNDDKKQAIFLLRNMVLHEKMLYVQNGCFHTTQKGKIESCIIKSNTIELEVANIFTSYNNRDSIKNEYFKEKILIKNAIESDASNMLKLESQCFGVNDANVTNLYRTIDVILYMYAFKASFGKKIVGGLFALPTRDNSIYVDSLFVDQKYRKNGMGERLLEKLLTIADSENKKVILHVPGVRTVAIDMYEKYGFIKNENIFVDYYEEGNDKIIMTRTPMGAKN